MGLRGWSFIIFGSGGGGGGGGGWPFYGGEGHFQKHYWFWEVISRCESINWGVIFINFIKVVNKQ